MTDDDEMAFEPGPTALDLLEQMATGRLPKSLYRGVVHAVHLRVPVHIWAQMSAIANLGNNSYNAASIMMFEVALEALKDRLSDEDLQRVNEYAGLCMAQFWVLKGVERDAEGRPAIADHPELWEEVGS